MCHKSLVSQTFTTVRSGAERNESTYIVLKYCIATLFVLGRSLQIVQLLN